MQTEQIETRLRRTERWLIVLGIALIVVVAGFSYLLYRPADTLRTSSLEVVDAQGNIVALLGQINGRTGLFLMDEKSTPRVSVFHADDMDGLYVDDDQGDTRVGVAQFSHGGGGFALHGPGSRGAAVLYYKNAGSLRFFDTDGNIIEEIPATLSK
ncbi:MAG: hypothetical protein WBS20_01775 [Lysobacterales bacterium]